MALSNVHPNNLISIEAGNEETEGDAIADDEVEVITEGAYKGNIESNKIGHMDQEVGVENKEENESCLDATDNSTGGDIQEDPIEENGSDADDSSTDDDISCRKADENENEKEIETAVIQSGTKSDENEGCDALSDSA